MSVTSPPENRPAGAAAGRPDPGPGTSQRRARALATVLGLLGALLALATPLLPVQQTVATLAWPQQSVLTDVTAPLVSYTPVSLEATVPCAVVAGAPDGAVLVSTVPRNGPDRQPVTATALVVRVVSGQLEVLVRNNPLLTTPVAGLGGQGCALRVTSTDTATTASVGDVTQTVAGDSRPQLTGVYSSLTGAAPAGLSVTALVDNRFSTSPSPLKTVAVVLGVLLVLGSLVALYRLESPARGRRALKVLPAGWWRLTARDVTVVGVLGVWYVIGANTSDDGYLLTMARASGPSGYMGNYYRWFGSPEAPFGWYYDVLALFAKVSTASPWVRLPELAAAVLCWLVISREVLPRLGRSVRRSQAAGWAAAAVFLSFWLPYDNGLRPESVIALGALLTWCSVERAIATSRVLPALVAVVVAAFSLAAGPTGLICVVALLAGARPLVHLFGARIREVGALPVLAPLAAAGFCVLYVVFADQTLATVLEATRVRTALGPSLAWYEELDRYTAVLSYSQDGGVARRFPVLVMFLGMGTCLLVMLRKGRIPGAALGPSRRLVGVVVGSVLALSLTPTKWPHHFGAFAGIGGALAALTALAVGAAALRSRRNRALFAAVLLVVLALALTGYNSWWYVSQFGIPWFDKPPSLKGIAFSSVVLAVAVVLALYAGYEHLRWGGRPAPARPTRENRLRVVRLASAPLTVVAGLVVLVEVLSFAKAVGSRWPSYTVGGSNIRAISGAPCALADDVLAETNPTGSLLTPRVASADALGTGGTSGFTVDGLPPDLRPDPTSSVARGDAGPGGQTSGSTTSGSTTSGSTTSGSTTSGSTTSGSTTSGSTAGGSVTADGSGGTTTGTDGTGTGTSTSTGTGTGAPGGSGAAGGGSVPLPFGLDPATVPVAGSYSSGVQQPAELQTSWYGLPPSSGATPLLIVTAAGQVASVNSDGIKQPGAALQVEFGRSDGGTVTPVGTATMLDPGPTPSWRNLRLPLDQAPAGADSVRVSVVDDNLDPNSWVAITPPRVPTLETLDTLVGHTDPVFLDWAVGLAFPCQRPFEVREGVAEVPAYRIRPLLTMQPGIDDWESASGGGPLGWNQLVNDTKTVPTYLSGDWNRDWGSLERLSPWEPDATTAALTTSTETRSGLSSDGPMWLPAP